MRTQTYENWLEEGTKRFGSKMRIWKFICPSCGHIQSAEQIIKNNNTELTVEEKNEILQTVNWNCEGRTNKKFGCMWSLGGLFQTHKLEITKDGRNIPTFEFSEAKS